MKVIIIPYADRAKCEWAGTFFPGHSIAALPLCGKPVLEYQLDVCANLGVTDVLVLDWGYEPALARRLGDGSRWGFNLIYTGLEGGTTLKEQIARQAGFLANGKVKFFLTNEVAGHELDSLQTYFDAHFAILENPGNLVLPGYSAESGVYAGANVVMKPDVEIAPPVVLGNNVRLERGVCITNGVSLGKGVVIDRGTRLSHAIVFPGTYVGKNMEIVNKIVAGRRVIDPASGAFVDLTEAGLSSDLICNAFARPLPATEEELRTRHYTGIHDLKTDAELAATLAQIGRDIAALDLPKVEGVYLGGGYGRGEGSAPFCNDLDFFVLTNGASEQDKDDIAVALDVVAMTYAPQFGESFHVDFCRAKNRSDFHRDENRIMIQELLRGAVPVYGRVEALNFLKRRDPTGLPLSEATRYLVNRGMGLLLARTRGSTNFARRNINKAILGAGDALLVAEGRYDWRLVEREKRLGDSTYSKAVAFKFHPVGEVASWEMAAEMWLKAYEKILAERPGDLKRRALWHAVRWLVRRRTLGERATFGMDPLTRILFPLARLVREGRHGRTIPAELMRDWEVFN